MAEIRPRACGSAASRSDVASGASETAWATSQEAFGHLVTNWTSFILKAATMR